MMGVCVYDVDYNNPKLHHTHSQASYALDCINRKIDKGFIVQETHYHKVVCSNRFSSKFLWNKLKRTSIPYCVLPKLLDSSSLHIQLETETQIWGKQLAKYQLPEINKNNKTTIKLNKNIISFHKKHYGSSSSDPLFEHIPNFRPISPKKWKVCLMFSEISESNTICGILFQFFIFFLLKLFDICLVILWWFRVSFQKVSAIAIVYSCK